MPIPLIWLASYPRSGNTFLRTIMFQCFGLRSASIYPNDLGSSPELQQAAGHIEHRDQRIDFGDEPFRLVKTHRLHEEGERRAIYVIRNGADTVRSAFEYYHGTVSLEQIIKGWRFGTWAQHVQAWNPRQRQDTLVLRYEDMRRDIGPVLDAISAFTGCAPVRRTLPDRSVLADGQWIKVVSDKQPFTADERALFEEINGATMAEYGYDV